MAFRLIKPTYELCSLLPDYEKFQLASQMRRAAVSIQANLAEGSSRSTDKDKARFLEMSLGSVYELEGHILVVKEVYSHLQVDADHLMQILVKVQGMLYLFRSKLREG